MFFPDTLEVLCVLQSLVETSTISFLGGIGCENAYDVVC